MVGSLSSLAHADPQINIVVGKEKMFASHPDHAIFYMVKFLKAVIWLLGFKTFCKAKFLHQARSHRSSKVFITCEEINQAYTQLHM